MAVRVTVVKGDLTEQEVDVLVNAANSTLLGGGGVDGAIHRAAGGELVEACRKIPEVGPSVRCPTGEARLTPGFRLPARWVVHTVGPVYASHPEPAVALASAIRASLELAVAAGARTVALPAISCGVFGYPHHEAARVAATVIREREWDLDEVRFVLRGGTSVGTWREALVG